MPMPKLPLNRDTLRRFRCLLVILPALCCLFANTAMADSPVATPKSSFSLWSPPIKFFQKYISRADGDRCPMYPSCSHYASQAFKRHGAMKGWILTCDRLLRCGHDEVRLSPKVRVKGKPRTYDPVKANTRWWSKP